MERSEPTLVPEWLKNSGSITGGGTTNQFAPSSLHSDDHGVSKPARIKSSVNISDQDSVRSPGSDRTTSSYFRRNSSSNGSAHVRSYSSFGRSHRDRDWDKDLNEYRDKEKSGFSDYRHRDYSDPLGNILPSRFEKDRLRRSQASISGKRGEPWPRKVPAVDSINANRNNHKNGNSVHKASFERDFPSLGAEERQGDTEIKRVPSPVLSSTIQNLPIGSSAVIGGDGWTSALAEVPVIVGSNGTSASGNATLASASASAASSPITGLNMAETLTQGPSRVQTTPQLSVGTQRLEELALKQSRQLIPVTPSVPKALVLNTSDKSKPKIGQQQHQHQNQITSPHHANHSPRGGPVKPDVSKTSSIGKLHVLKPARERNGISPAPKDSLSPTNVGKLPNSPLAVAPSVVGTAPLRSPGSNPVPAGADRKPALTVLEKKPTPQAQSRHDFFNLMRKKSMTNSVTPDPSPMVSPPVLDKQTEAAPEHAIPTQDRDDPVPDGSGGAQLIDMTHNGDNCDGSKKYMNNGKNHSRFEVILYPEEEEVSFLRSLGWPWEENSGEDEGLTEEEINAFRSKYPNSKPSSKIFQRIRSSESDLEP